MDPIGASSFNIHAGNQQDDRENDILNGLGSRASLGIYEKRSLRNLLPQIFGTLIVSSGFITIGISLAFSAVLIPQLEQNGDFSVDKNEASWIASVLVLVAPIVSLISGYVMDVVGRLNTMKMALIPAIIGWILIATAYNIPMMIVGRIFTGISGPLTTSPAVVYMTEIARKDMRGSLLSVGPCFISLGMVIAYLEGWLLGWRFVAWSCIGYTIIPFLCLYLIHESPQWLVSKNRLFEAKDALNWLHKNQPRPGDWNESFAQLTLELLKREQERKKRENERSKPSRIRGFFQPTGYKPLLILLGLFICQQFSGVYIFLFYSVTFFEHVGSTVNPYMASVLIGVIRFFMAALNTWLLKSFKRRTLIFFSAGGMAISTFISATFTYLIKKELITITWIPVVALLFYMIFSMTGLLTIPWTMTAELFPLEIRSMGHSISTALVNLIMFLAIQNYMNLEEFFNGSAGIQWFFSAISLLAVIYSFIFLPETHEKKLSDIENYFRNNTIYMGHHKVVNKQTKRNLVSERGEMSEMIERS